MCLTSLHTETLQDVDVEEVQRLIIREQIRCRTLEVDEEVERLRAAELRNILDNFAGEDTSGSTEPGAIRVLHAARSALAPPTLPAASPSSGPEVLAIARQPSANSPVVSRKRKSSSAENPRPARISKSKCLVPINNNNSKANTSTSESCSRSSLVTRNASSSVLDASVVGVLKSAGLTSLDLTRAESICADETPGIRRSMFCNKFGGALRSEWPKCTKQPGYQEFLCTDAYIQPLMPRDAGKLGLLLRLPAVTELSQNNNSTFHVLATMRKGGTLHYLGKYAKIPLPQLQFKWKNTSRDFKERWIRRAQSLLATRLLRARISLRNREKREPAAAEVEEYSRLHFEDKMTFREVSAAFQAGEERLIVDGIYCIAYDSQLATIIQDCANSN